MNPWSPTGLLRTVATASPNAYTISGHLFDTTSGNPLLRSTGRTFSSSCLSLFFFFKLFLNFFFYYAVMESVWFSTCRSFTSFKNHGESWGDKKKVQTVLWGVSGSYQSFIKMKMNVNVCVVGEVKKKWRKKNYSSYLVCREIPQIEIKV